jgi:hypothetical protein
MDTPAKLVEYWQRQALHRQKQSARGERMTKNNHRLTTLLLMCGLAAGVAGAVRAQDFLPYEGKNAIREGEGGTKKVVNGIDFWADGAPPRQFKLLGYISDRRHKSGLIGMIRMSGLESDIADVAKQNGGDAVILVSSEAETIGSVGNTFGQVQANANSNGGNTTGHATGWSTGTTSAVQKQQSKYAVVKYIEAPKPDSGPPPPPFGEVKSSNDGNPTSVPPAQPAN